MRHLHTVPHRLSEIETRNRMFRLTARTVLHSLPENPPCLPKEEPILRRASRFISSTCLWSALLCHINVGESAEVGRAKAADQNAAATAAPKSARQLYSA